MGINSFLARKRLRVTVETLLGVQNAFPKSIYTQLSAEYPYDFAAIQDQEIKEDILFLFLEWRANHYQSHEGIDLSKPATPEQRESFLLNLIFRPYIEYMGIPSVIGGVSQLSENFMKFMLRIPNNETTYRRRSFSMNSIFVELSHYFYIDDPDAFQSYVDEMPNKYSEMQADLLSPSGEIALQKSVDEDHASPKSEEDTKTLADGDKYVGEFRDGKRHGQGIYTYANGDKYVGEYRDGKKHGQGIYTFADGDKYVGEWRYGKKHGHFTVTSANGDKYVGEYRDGEKHGRGTLTLNDGNVMEGIWENGQMVE